VLDQSIDATTPTGWLVLTIFGGIAEMERTQMLERQRIGIEKARADKKYKGRKPVAADKVAEIKRLKADGRRPTDIAKMAKVARSTVYKVLEAA
jgi:DNA invertase Pin-like site-specific DNA recombinase